MNAYRRGSRYYVEFVDGTGKRVRQSTNAVTMKEAQRLERELKVRAERQRLGLEVHDRNPNRWTMRQGVEWWINNIGRKQAQGKSASAMLKKHVVGDFGALPLEQVTGARVEDWLSGIEDAGLSASTVNGLRALLMGVFTKMKKRAKFYGENPVKETERREVAAPAPATMPVEAVRALLDTVTEEPMRTLIWAAAYTGARRSELVNMSWANIDFGRGIITLTKTKRKKTRVVPIHPELRPVLEAAKSAHFTTTLQAVHRSARFVREALAAAGVTLPDGTEATFKMLRATWASRLVECGARIDIVRLIGWGAKTGDVMETFYLRVGLDVLAAEVAKLSWPRVVQGNVVEMKGRA